MYYVASSFHGNGLILSGKFSSPQRCIFFTIRQFPLSLGRLSHTRTQVGDDRFSKSGLKCICTCVGIKWCII